MLRRLLHTLIVAFVVPAFAIAAAAPALAPEMIEGTVMTAGDGKMIVQDQDGKKMHNLDVAEDAKINRDGMEVRLENLMTGDWAKITTEKRLPLQSVVTAVDARSRK
jgi:hypothetical protein